MSGARPATGTPWWTQLRARPLAGAVHGSIEVVNLEELQALRRQVLRAGRTDVPLGSPRDSDPSSLHLAALDPGGLVLGALTLRVECDPDPAAESNPLRLTGMAVAAPAQGHGIGSQLLAVAQEMAGTAGLGIWATARDSALGFYRRHRFEVIGEGFEAAMGLPHHHVVWRPAPASTAGACPNGVSPQGAPIRLPPGGVGEQREGDAGQGG